MAFTRNPATGENLFYGEWLPNAQGEDVVAGIRTPNPLNESTRSTSAGDLPSLEEAMPTTYKELVAVRNKLEKYFRDMQDLEFTIQEGKLWMLQTRSGKRNGPAAVRMAVDMVQGKTHHAQRSRDARDAGAAGRTAAPDPRPEGREGRRATIAKGLPAGPGGATGQVVFTANDAVAWAQQGKKVILVREETNPEDVEGMRAAIGILTARGGMTSHAALVARGWGKCCIVGAGGIKVDVHAKDVQRRRRDNQGRRAGSASTAPRELVYQGAVARWWATRTIRTSRSS